MGMVFGIVLNDVYIHGVGDVRSAQLLTLFFQQGGQKGAYSGVNHGIATVLVSTIVRDHDGCDHTTTAGRKMRGKNIRVDLTGFFGRLG